MLILVSKFEGRTGRHCNGGPRATQPTCATVRKASQKSTVEEEDPVRKFLWANAHFFEIVVESTFIFGVGTAFPHLFFQHYTPAYNDTFLFHSIENCDISSWTTTVLQPAETFPMSQCTILRKENAAAVCYTWESLAPQSSLARYTHIICCNSNLLLPYARLANEETQIPLDKIRPVVEPRCVKISATYHQRYDHTFFNGVLTFFP